MRKADWFILAGVLALAAVLALWQLLGREEELSLTADLYVAGALVESVPLTGPDRDIVLPCLGGVNVVRVEKGAVFMLRADCPGQFCVSQGPIRRAGQTIACLPHRVLIVLSGAHGERGDVDAVAG